MLAWNKEFLTPDSKSYNPNTLYGDVIWQSSHSSLIPLESCVFHEVSKIRYLCRKL